MIVDAIVHLDWEWALGPFQDKISNLQHLKKGETKTMLILSRAARCCQIGPWGP